MRMVKVAVGETVRDTESIIGVNRDENDGSSGARRMMRSQLLAAAKVEASGKTRTLNGMALIPTANKEWDGF
jgi:hypothetical protein